MSDNEEDPWIVEEAYLASKAPGKQTVPRADTWAVYLVLHEWYGAYDLEIITDASYTVSGMDFTRRASNLKGANKDLWKLIYDEIDYSAGDGETHLQQPPGGDCDHQDQIAQRRHSYLLPSNSHLADWRQ